MSHDSHPVMAGFSANPDYDYEIRCVLGRSAAGASDLGEVLAATAGIRKNDHDAWFAAWRDLGQRTADRAATSAADGHRVSAAEGYLRASSYLGVAVNAVSALEDDADLTPTFRTQQDTWDSFVSFTSADVTRVDIPYESTSLPGYIFRPSPRGESQTRPTLVAVNGSDGSLAGVWATCVAAALLRGYNVLVFDGPGQQTQLFERGVRFRPDWENVLTPVYDFVSAQADVDPNRVAVYGISQGGYWVPRALAFEHRFAAAVADPGIVDVSTSWTGHLPKSLLALLDKAQNEKFDKEMAIGMKFSPATARTWQFRARPYGTTGFAETIAAVRTYTLSDLEAGQITTPLLITDPQGEQFWPGQSEKLASLTPTVSTLLPFAADEGAGGHCEPLARGLAAQQVFDWLDTKLAPCGHL